MMSRFWECVDNAGNPEHTFSQRDLLMFANETGSNRLTCIKCAELGAQHKPHSFGWMRPTRSDAQTNVQAMRAA